MFNNNNNMTIIILDYTTIRLRSNVIFYIPNNNKVYCLFLNLLIKFIYNGMDCYLSIMIHDVKR